MERRRRFFTKSRDESGIVGFSMLGTGGTHVTNRPTTKTKTILEALAASLALRSTLQFDRTRKSSKISHFLTQSQMLTSPTHSPFFSYQLDLSSLPPEALQKYKRAFKLKIKPSTPQEQVAEFCQKHYENLEVSEKDAIVYFIYSVRNQGNILKLPPADIAERTTTTRKEGSSYY